MSQAKVSETTERPKNFIENIIDEDNLSGKHGGRVHTRFPPEPNGYLHIGHAKSITINFGLAKKYGGKCNLRFDDTNPLREDIEFIEAIKEDVRWMGFDWHELRYASSYFEQLYDFAVQLIKKGKAYVDSLSEEDVRKYRGSLTEPGKNSPFRDRSVAENLDLFTRMRNGEFREGEHILRAKIDMSSGNMNMRDPLLYRIRYAHHPMTGDKWCIYPLYDYTHGISDAIEGITHSICTLEFEDHRPLYDWFLQELEWKNPPQQIEFAKGKINYWAMGKRNLRELVEEKYVAGWDDPRMPTLKGLRRRGYTAASLRNFWEQAGVTKSESIIDMSVLEESLRQDLNEIAPRRMAVLDPLKVVLTNVSADELYTAPNHPQKPEMGTRQLPFSNELYIEREDFEENPPPGYHRLKPGGEVRLRNAYIMKCDEVIKDTAGNVVELRGSIDKNTLGKNPEGRKVKGIIHWVSAKHALKAEVRLYDRLFNAENPTGDKTRDYKEFLNPDSLNILKNCFVEPSLVGAPAESSYQFERLGYFCVDNRDSKAGALVFNRAVTLRDTWAKESGK